MEPNAVSTAPLFRYLTAYRLGIIGEVLFAASGPTTKSADKKCSPFSQWSLSERQYINFLSWVTTKAFRPKCVCADDNLSIVRTILSFVEVSPPPKFSSQLKGGKRKRDDDSATSSGRSDLYSKCDTSSNNDDLMPCFFVSAPFTNCVSLFVRLSSSVTYTDEELNHVFGRYGMISAKRVGKRASEASATSREENQCDHLQNFIVTLDVNRNCLRAVQEIRHSEVVLIAFSKPGRNVYCIGDLPSAPTRMQTLLRSVVPFSQGSSSFSHIVASLRLAQGGLWLNKDGEALDGSNRASTDLSLATSFIPDLVVDHLPYWVTREQLKERFAMFGTVRSLKLSVDDRNGSFMGVALVNMGSLEESLTASESLHGTEISDGWPMTVGILTDELNIVSLRTGDILSQCEDPNALNFIGSSFTEQPRMWL